MSPNLGKRKVFVSYKYKDPNVLQLPGITAGEDTGYMITPRHYVDIIIELIGADHIYKGEISGEDASHLADTTIDSALKRKLFDSSVTIALLSPGMIDKTKAQEDQWIPNEIYYSLRNKTRGDRTSKTNALLLVALPDILGNYDHAVVHKACGVTSWQTPNFFEVIKKNMFNKIDKNTGSCDGCLTYHHYGDDHSYAYPVKWNDFVVDHNKYIDHVLSLRDRIAEFDIKKIRGPEYA